MAGTVITYQGFKASSVTARRSRGWSADISTVSFPVASFPTNFDFTPPRPGDILGEPGKEPDPLAAIKAKPKLRPISGAQFSPGKRNSLLWGGYLTMAESVNGKEWSL